MNMMTNLMTSINLIAGTIVTASSHHWLMAWAGLELNMLSILTFIMKPKNPRATEAAIKYFLTQTIASTMMLFSGTVNAIQTGQWNISQMTDKYACTILILAMTMKIGAAPIHFWLPEVMQGSSTMTAMIIASWQKIAPISILFMTYNHLPPKIMVIIGIASATIGGWGGINQTQLRKLMAYSSISNIGWTMVIFTASPHTATLNIAIYMIMIIPAFMLIKKMSLKTLRDSSTTWTSSPLASTMLALMLLSLSGLPPLTGFAPKILILNELIMQNLTPIATIMAMISLISLFFYVRTTYITTMTTPPIMTLTSMKWRLTQSQQKLTSMLMPLSLMTLLITPILTSMT
uniref:NADH-ubiquinone oxidoreductase chain 2 n=1 Tax=Trioceros melleri TaxID=179915 RepID=Q8SHF7_TRIMD|nr:NADH dehydrogenase subunit 2 [Trioceros melleri]AAL90546.1 NADH dehydrogenase subunit 2 [Trioceros melleri]BAJ08087.1 NADH dehydrogenase subunit 2 [Trioceros melleri]